LFIFQGIVTNLSSNNNNNHNNNNNVDNVNNKLTIQEIGQETLEREMSREKMDPNFEVPTKIKVQIEQPKIERSKDFTNVEKSKIFGNVEKSSTTSNVEKSKSFVNVEKSTTSNIEKSTKKDETKVNPNLMKSKFFESPKVSVRHVPIRLDDGKVIQRDPDETMEIR
jgi:hypothetical protein